MSPARHTAQHDRRAIAALFAVFALLVQAMIPAAAMARPDPLGAQLICTSTGFQTVTASGRPASPDKRAAGMPCQDCLAAAMACLITPTLAVTPITYAVARVEHAAAAPLIEPRARAPPRPPGQGPPTA